MRPWVCNACLRRLQQDTAARLTRRRQRHPQQGPSQYVRSFTRPATSPKEKSSRKTDSEAPGDLEALINAEIWAITSDILRDPPKPKPASKGQAPRYRRIGFMDSPAAESTDQQSEEHGDGQQQSERKRLAQLDWLREKARSRSFSVPEPQNFYGLRKQDVRDNRIIKTFEDVESATWFAHRATPPLLLTFDAFNTLIHPESPVHLQYASVAAKHGYACNPDELKQSLVRAMGAVYEQHPNYGKETGLSVKQWWTAVIHRTFQEALPTLHNDHIDIDSPLADELYTRFASSAGYELFDDVLPLLQHIGTSFAVSDWAPKRTMLGVISNSDPRISSVLSSFDISLRQALFPPRYAPVHRRDAPTFGPASLAFTTYSYDAGISKPDPRIFDAALRAAQDVLAAHAPVARLTRSARDLLRSVREDFWHLHVGDSAKEDVHAALAAGWDAVLLDRSADDAISERHDAGTSITVINSLAHLPALLTPERAQRAIERGHRVRAERQAAGPDMHALDFEDAVDPHGRVGLAPEELRTPESRRFIGRIRRSETIEGFGEAEDVDDAGEVEQAV